MLPRIRKREKKKSQNMVIVFTSILFVFNFFCVKYDLIGQNKEISMKYKSVYFKDFHQVHIFSN